MKNIVSIVFVVALIALGYVYFNPPVNDAAPEISMSDETLNDVIEPATTEEIVSPTETSTTEESMITPADISEEAQETMYQLTSAYNKCMMQSRLEASQDGHQVQEAANDILNLCEKYLDELKAHLSANNVNESLVMGMTKKMRSRGARKLMTQSMNNMAAQASAAANAQQMEAEAAAE